ncbi:MAG: hypothetical protein AAFW46_19395, partial [Pseudomonadota bacterium]
GRCTLAPTEDGEPPGRFWLLSDPDLLNNHGLRLGDNAAIAAAAEDHGAAGADQRRAVGALGQVEDLGQVEQRLAQVVAPGDGDPGHRLGQDADAAEGGVADAFDQAGLAPGAADLLNNHGLRLGDNAAIAAALLPDFADGGLAVIDYTTRIWVIERTRRERRVVAEAQAVVVEEIGIGQQP